MSEPQSIWVTINGDRREVAASQTVRQFLADRGVEPRMVVVERNGEIVPRVLLSETPMEEGDTLEIVQMMAGG